MKPFPHPLKPWVCFALVIVWQFSFGAGASYADPILTVSGPSSANLDIFSLAGLPDDRGLWWGISFTLNTTFKNVAFTPILGYDPQQGNFHGMAFLTTTLPVSSPPSVIASNSFGFSSGNGTPAPLTVLGGLTLGPGTYYFLLTGQIPSSSGIGFSGVAHWPDLSSPLVTVSPGVTTGSFWFAGGGGVDPLLPPSAFWQLDSNTLHAPIQITGTVVPEPGTLTLLALGLAGLAGLRRRLASAKSSGNRSADCEVL